MDRPTKPLKRARLLHAFKTGFSAAYDSIGFVIAVSLVCFVVVMLISLAAVSIVQANDRLFAAAVSVGVVLSSVCVWMVLLGAVFYATAKARHGSADIGEAVGAMRGYAAIALRLYFVNLLVWIVLLGDLVFFLRLASTGGNLLYAIIGVVFGYMGLLWAMMTMYHLPLVAAYERPASEIRVWAVVRDSFVLLGGSPGFTAWVFLAIIALACLCALPALVGTALVFPGTAAFLAVFALHELFIRFGIVKEEDGTVEDKPWKLPDGE